MGELSRTYSDTLVQSRGHCNPLWLQAKAKGHTSAITSKRGYEMDLGINGASLLGSAYIMFAVGFTTEVSPTTLTVEHLIPREAFGIFDEGALVHSNHSMEVLYRHARAH